MLWLYIILHTCVLQLVSSKMCEIMTETMVQLRDAYEIALTASYLPCDMVYTFAI